MSSIKVWNAKKIPKELLSTDPKNSQKQTKKTFDALKLSIQENGFDENLIVTPKDDGTFMIRSGNHRFKAGVAVGMEEFPCVVRTDWDEVRAAIENVKRNVCRGSLDKALFTDAVNALAAETNLAFADISEQMGFDDLEKFSAFYQSEKVREERAVREIDSESLGKVKMVENLGSIISLIVEKYGETVPYSFIVFPAGGKHHLYINCNKSLKGCMEAITERCIADNMDINLAVTGLLQIGMDTCNFQAGNCTQATDAVKDATPDDIEPIDLGKLNG